MTKEIITQLTPEQEAAIPRYRDAGIEIGLRTDPTMDKEKIIELINSNMVMCEKEPIPKENFIFMDSPMAAMREYGKYGISPQNAFYGQHDIHWLMYYTFFRVECGLVEETEKIKYLMELTKHVGWFWLSDDTAIITARPKKLCLVSKLNPNTKESIQVLHNPDGLAVEYADGEGVYCLNGIFIDEKHDWIIKTPKEQLDLKTVLGIQNVEIRNEAIKKMGENAYKNVGKVIDSSEMKIDTYVGSLFENNKGLKATTTNYNLFEIDLGERVKRKYLEGFCPSSGKKFFEAVHPDVSTCTQALHWREWGKLEVEENGYLPPLVRT